MFSLILPTFNRSWILEQPLQQILKQDDPDWELWVVDDGSTGNTREMVESAAARDNRIHYLYQPNQGAAAARQNGLNHATGDWVTYVDSDDALYPFYLSRAREFFRTHPEVWYAFAYNRRTLELVDQDHRVLQTKEDPATLRNPRTITLKDYAHWNIKPCGTGIFHKRSIIIPDIQWDTSFTAMEDIDFVFQLGLKYPDHFGFIPEPLFHQRQAFGADGVCSNTSYGEWADRFERIYLKYKDTWLMEGQTWYPSKVEKYRGQQRLLEEGKIGEAWKRYFS